MRYSEVREIVFKSERMWLLFRKMENFDSKKEVFMTIVIVKRRAMR